MAVLSAACNYNPVIFLKYPANFIFTGLGISVDSDPVSHRLDNAGMTGTCLPNALTMLQTIDKYYASKFAKLVGMLDGIKNGDGSTLLDSTATVWFNEFSDGLAGNLNNLPIIQAGGCGGYFKTGWTVNVDTANPGSPTLTRGNSEAQCADGTANGTVNGVTQATGTDPNVANGTDQQVLLQPDERRGREGGRERIPDEGWRRGGEQVRLLRSDDGLQRRFRRRCGGHDPQPRRVHRAQGRLLSHPPAGAAPWPGPTIAFMNFP